jgi:streptogramin lyase
VEPAFVNHDAKEFWMSLPMTAVSGGSKMAPVGGSRKSMVGMILVLVALFCGVAAQAALAAAPEVFEVTPKEGPAAGGTEVTIEGGNFEEVTGVHFGSTAAIKYTVSSHSKIKAEAPTHADATVDITVETKAGTSKTSSFDHYKFTGALPKAPESVTLPEMSPEPPVENTLETVTTGTWTNLPSSYQYQWSHCVGKSCEEIEGAREAAYYPPYSYVGQTLEVSVTAVNAGGESKPAYVESTKTVASNGVVEYHTGFDGLTGIASGPEEHVWFSSSTAFVSGLGEMTTAGAIVKEFPLGEEVRPQSIAEGADHNMWFTEWGEGKIGKITTSGTTTSYALTEGSEPYDIVKGPDGDMWFTEQGQGTSWGKVGKITTSGTVTVYPLPETENEPVPIDITSGPEESLWVTVEYRKTTGAAKIDKITTAGKITEYKLPKCVEFGEAPEGITEGSEGDLWYTQATCDKIGKLTPAGVFSEYEAGPRYPRDITRGPEGDLWYTSWGLGNSHVTKMTSAGVISAEYALPGNSDPVGITVGPNKDMWIGAGSEVATIEP